MQQPELYIGLMSGTSLDGIDAVLVDLSHPKPVQLANYYLPFDDTLKHSLLALHQPGHNELHLAQVIGNQLARMYAQSIVPLLSQTGIAAKQVCAIGCHGQTIRHRPEHGYSLQIGNAALLAELTGITVVSDFRSRDIAAGGQGAPLVPAFHEHLLRHPGIHRVIVNIGGISNLTNLPPDTAASDRPSQSSNLPDKVAAAISAPDARAHHAMTATSGFDCGPGNLLMDVWCTKHTGKPYDDNGAWAASGQVLPGLLERMLEEPFFSVTPPKSSGRDLFNTAWLLGRLTGHEAAVDVQATLLELTCATIAQAIRQHCTGAREIYLCGGGAHNRALGIRLSALLADCGIRTTGALGIDGDFMESIAFAWLAQQALHGKPANLPLVTGARHPCILGAVYRSL